MSNTNNNPAKLKNVVSISAQIKQIALLGTCELVKKSHTINSQFLHPVDSFPQCRSLTFWNTKFRLAPTCKNLNKHL